MFAFLVFLAVYIVLAWNFYPPFRARLKGWSTLAEAGIAAVFTYFGVFAEAIKEAQFEGYLPANLETYVPYILLAWVVIKRVQTKTPVGPLGEGKLP